MPTKHALLSASSASRWLHCPPSARLGENYEDKPSEYAAEGTEAHALGEYKILKALKRRAVNPTKKLKYFSEEMDECTDGYKDMVLELVMSAGATCEDPQVLIEQRVDFSRWVPMGFGTGDCLIVADKVLHIIDLDNEIRNYPTQLSGGQQQRVVIGRAIANRPGLLICDEPTGNLDPRHAKEIIELLQKINDGGTTVIVVTHDEALVENYRKRTILLDNGRIISDNAQGGYSHV